MLASDCKNLSLSQNHKNMGGSSPKRDSDGTSKRKRASTGVEKRTRSKRDPNKDSDQNNETWVYDRIK